MEGGIHYISSLICLLCPLKRGQKELLFSWLQRQTERQAERQTETERFFKEREGAEKEREKPDGLALLQRRPQTKELLHRNGNKQGMA